MATRSNPKKQRRGKRPPKQSKPMSEAEREDLELAEELLRVGKEEEAGFIAGMKKFMKQLGIKEKPIGAKKLKERMLAEGFDPESNEFSRGIIEMREE
ncbi:MAG TPA: hypothetical protein VGZ47_20090 [Gemmataceae bacterium]|jgi:hypothetical protein|nr:hypothetical protein [Gemmataceae bacterium]